MASEVLLWGSLPLRIFDRLLVLYEALKIKIRRCLSQELNAFNELAPPRTPEVEDLADLSIKFSGETEVSDRRRLIVCSLLLKIPFCIDH